MRTPRADDRFAWKVPAHVLGAPEEDLGAIHALELSFVFGTDDIIAPGADRLLEDPIQRERVMALSRAMRSAWTNCPPAVLVNNVRSRSARCS